MYGIFNLDEDKRYVVPHYSNLNSTINITEKKRICQTAVCLSVKAKVCITVVKQNYCARKAARQTGAFHVELAQTMAEAIWGKASLVPLRHVNLYGQLTPRMLEPGSPFPTGLCLRPCGMRLLCLFCFSVRLHEIMTQRGFPSASSLDKHGDWQGFQICSVTCFWIHRCGT